MAKDITLHIFSKDRPMQLECLLRSVEENSKIFKAIYVQYASNDKYIDGYIKLMDMYPDVYFVLENEVGFRQTFLNILNDVKGRVCYMVDDDILFGKVSQVPNVSIFSLRLGQNIKNQIHHEYTGSVDGNIFRKHLLKGIEDELFYNPNQLEVVILKLTRGVEMKHFETSKLIGIPNNKVSNTSKCSDMGGSLERLNNLFADGWVIDYKKMDLTCNNVHKEIPYELKRIEYTEEVITKN